MDVVYLFKEDSGNNSEELRYSLRSLQNIPHNNVVIVGEKPEWVTNVIYISIAQTKTKHENVEANLLAAAQSSEVSDDFIIMNDDFFIMKKISEIPSLNFGYTQNVIRSYRERYPEGSYYIDMMQRVQDMLIYRGHDNPVSYELHTPMVLSKQKLLDLRQDIGGCIDLYRTLYGNLFEVGGVVVDDVKVFLSPKHNDPLYNNDPDGYLEAQTLLSATGGAFKRGAVGEFVRSRFPEKSIYEI